MVRTSENGTRVEIRPLKESGLSQGGWKTVWPHSKASIPRPLFLDESEFVFPAGNSVQLFTSTGKARDKVDCINAVKTAVSRNGKFLATACIPVPADNAAVLAGARSVVSFQLATDDSHKGDERSNVVTF